MCSVMKEKEIQGEKRSSIPGSWGFCVSKTKARFVQTLL